jgi:UDP-2,3-diacylglucosamine hydrolase
MIYFISDIHLGYFDRQKDALRENLLLRFLNDIEQDCEVLYIVGDLFDYWFEYDALIPKYFYRTLTCLNEMRQKGIKIEYLMGNHDFGHRDFFEKELGIPVYKDDISRTHSGKKFYISHGDGKAINDFWYNILKKVLRSRLSLWLYRQLPPDVSIGLASTTSKKSRHYTDKKNFGEVEGLEQFAEAQINSGCDFVIMGHRHKAYTKTFGSGLYVNLGDWFTQPKYAVFDGKELLLRDVS